MPFFQVMSNRASDIFSFDRINDIDATRVADATSLVQLMEGLGIAQTNKEISVAEDIPMALQRSILSVIKYAVEQPEGEREQITVAWAPGYDWSVKIWEAHAVQGSPAALTILLEGPYPK